MADRKVLVKYIPKNFNADLLVKRGRGKDKLMIVRNMLPMSLRCNTCSNYLYIGTKFNMRMEICNDEVYLGIKVFRFYLKCTYCYADICFKTDPKNHDYVVETGGTRNYEAIKDAQQAEKLMKKIKNNQKEGNSMKYLQNKTYDSKRQMDLMEALDDIKNLNKRQGIIDPEDLLKGLIYQEEQEQTLTQDQEREIQEQYNRLRMAKGLPVNSLNGVKLPIKEEVEQDDEDSQPNLKRQQQAPQVHVNMEGQPAELQANTNVCSSIPRDLSKTLTVPQVLVKLEATISVSNSDPCKYKPICKPITKPNQPKKVIVKIIKKKSQITQSV